MLLYESKIQSTLKITGFSVSEKVLNHLIELGLVEGVLIKLISLMNGSAIIILHDSRIALDKSISKSITVEEIND
jgi:Fe2+ transport system protein FeoA